MTWMRSSRVAIFSVLSAVLLASPAVPAETRSTPSPGPESVPDLVIVHPTEGELFSDTPIVVQVEVKNFELQPPKPYFGTASDKSVGHLHYFLDDYPEIATNSTEIMFGKKDGKDYLKRGTHTIAVELVHDNHDNLSPRVWKRVDFVVSH